MRDVDATEDDVWRSLRDAFQPHDVQNWPDPKVMAKRYLHQLAHIVRHEGTPALGLSVHQAKGLEWDRVLFLDGDLSTSSGTANVLSIDEASHRSVYVGLTRARAKVRVMPATATAYGARRSEIDHVVIHEQAL